MDEEASENKSAFPFEDLLEALREHSLRVPALSLMVTALGFITTPLLFETTQPRTPRHSTALQSDIVVILIDVEGT